MTAQSKTTIKSYFQTSDKPTEAQFVDFIDSYQDANSNLLILASASTPGTFGLTLLGTATTTINILVPTVDGTATGTTTNSFNSGYSSTAVGDLVYLDSAATWQKADANTTTLNNSLLGIALEVKAAAAAVSVALSGSMVYAAAAFPTFTVGLPVYMSETAGAVTQTPPTTTDAADRVIGFAIHADKLLFLPEPGTNTHT